MSTTRTFAYVDGLYAPVLLREIRAAESSMQVVMFIFKTSYAGDTVAKEILDALNEAAARGVKVLVILNYSRFEPSVRRENWASAEKLAAGGCHVRLGPVNQTVHAKIVLIDLMMVFVGSHNFTRGAFQFNREATSLHGTRYMINRYGNYFTELWNNSTRFEETPPPDADLGPVEISLTGETAVGDAIELTFGVNHIVGVDAFAAVSDDGLDLIGANMGEAVTPDQRVARVVPTVEAGTKVYLAVRAYQTGTIEATSNIVSMIYQPAAPGGGGGDEGGGGDTPPPEPLTAPTVTSVTQVSPPTVTVDWTFIGAADFQRFIIQQRDLELGWHEIGIVLDANVREWTGAPNSMDSLNPFRVVVYNTADESATSNEVLLTLPTLTAPVLSSVVAGLNGTEITATWTFPGCENFHRFEVQKEVGADWSVVGSTLDPAVRQWVGPGPGAGFTEATYRIVVFNMAEESAASNEITITGEPPVPLQAPVVVSVTQIGPMGIDVEWSHVTPTEFTRYEVQQRTNETWNTLATITTPETRSWSGGPIPYMDADHPVRVVVFVQSGDSAGSNEMAITLM